jgi:hypothetical protein
LAADLPISGTVRNRKSFAAGCIEGALLSFGLAMGEQQPAIIADEVPDKRVPWRGDIVFIVASSRRVSTYLSGQVSAVPRP